MTARNEHCCLCGTLRRPTQKPLEAFSNGIESIQISDHRPLLDGRWETSGGQLLVSVSMWRNGGSAPGQTHICDECVVVGLKAAKRFVDQSLAALSNSERTDG